MTSTLVLAILGSLVLMVVVELVAAVLPLVLIVALVPHHERRDLAELLAAADSSRRLRLWPALRIAVATRRRQRALSARTPPGAPPRSPIGKGSR
ncbi:MAG: hypothetical protein ABW022_06965 [Actinoplanes sp.]